MSAINRPAGPGRPARGDTRGTIINEAARLFALKGYEGASIGEIALATGISKPAIYHYFTDKDEIYEEIVVTVMQGMLDNATQNLTRVTSPAERLKAFMIAHATFFDRHRHSYIAAQLGFRGLRSTGRDAALGLRDSYEQLLRDILAEAHRAGVLLVPDVAMTGRLILSSLNWMARWYQVDGARTARDIASQYADILLNGLLPRVPQMDSSRATGRTTQEGNEE
jgi:TetR/AcrR family transcriptional regulator, cholesterol catabolism regulator